MLPQTGGGGGGGGKCKEEVQNQAHMTCSGGGVSTARNSTSLGTSPASMTSAMGGLTSTQKGHMVTDMLSW